MYGYLGNSTFRQPVMAHPPDEKSDITLNEFLTRIWDFNAGVSKERQKGVKLDFKSRDVFENSLQILNEKWTTNYEIWLNADIYSGPVNSTSTPVDPTFFFTEAKKFENSVLSIGWTTRWEGMEDGSYTREQINAMIDGVRKNNVKNSLTFPVRAGIAANSLDELIYLYNELKNDNHVTFTIWSSESDFVDVEGLRKMIFAFGIDKIYIDVPDILYNQLQLDNDPHSNGGISFKATTAFLGLLLLITFLRHLFS